MLTAAFLRNWQMIVLDEGCRYGTDYAEGSEVGEQRGFLVAHESFRPRMLRRRLVTQSQKSQASPPLSPENSISGQSLKSSVWIIANATRAASGAGTAHVDEQMSAGGS
jgi:hypothetical protein